MEHILQKLWIKQEEVILKFKVEYLESVQKTKGVRALLKSSCKANISSLTKLDKSLLSEIHRAFLKTGKE